MKLKLNALLMASYLEGLTEKNSPFINNQYVRWTYNKDLNKLDWIINTSNYQICTTTNQDDILEPHTESFDIGLNSEKLFAVIKSLKDPEVTITFDDNHNVKFKNGSTKVVVSTIIGLELPEPNEINPTLWSQSSFFSIDIFKDIAKLPTFTTVDSTAFSGVMLGFKNNGFGLYSSNRNTLYYILNSATTTASDTCILPKVFVTALAKLPIGPTAKIKVGKLSDTGLYVVAWTDTNGKGYISSRKLEHAVPNITRVLDIDYGYSFTMNKNELLDSVKLYEVIAELSSVTLEFTQTELVIDHPLLNRRLTLTSPATLPATFEPFKVTLGVKDITNILNTLDKDTVTIETNGTNNAIRIKEDNKTIVQAKMRRF